MSPHRFQASARRLLDDEDRRRRQPPEEVLDRMGTWPGDIWVDMGCGVGYFTRPLADRATRVIALDAQKEMIATLVSRATERQLERVCPVLADIPPLPLRDASVDGALMVNVLHEVEDKHLLVEEIHRVLRPRGRVSLVDFHKRPDSHGPPVEERVSPGEAAALFRRFREVGRWEMRSYYQMEMTR
jgi:ubiquinone/menaquinone biosynthesis C-methylase UbiE